MKRHFPVLLCGIALAGALGCRSIYYSAWESLGKHKRDLLKERVEDARDGQETAAKQFKDALTRLKELTRFDGGDLEKAYNALKADQDRFTARADALRERIRAMEQVAKDLFAEWTGEIESISSPRLREDSRVKLKRTQERFDELSMAMKRAEQGMEPVLTQFRDYVLYLKHNLNAQAIGSLRGESLNIEKEMLQLIAEMNSAISKADAFVKELPE